MTKTEAIERASEEVGLQRGYRSLVIPLLNVAHVWLVSATLRSVEGPTGTSRGGGTEGFTLMRRSHGGAALPGTQPGRASRCVPALRPVVAVRDPTDLVALPALYGAGRVQRAREGA